MRILTLAMVFAVGCSQPNPEACCTTAEQCLMFGLGGITNCDSTHVCNIDGNCVAPMCKVDADCNDASMVCDMYGECVPAAGPTDCTVPTHACATGVCDTASKMCVECVDNSTCSGTSPICSLETCVACSDYTDCPTTACSSTGACATTSDISYVASAAKGGTANANCTFATPCTSLATAMTLAPAIIRVKGQIVATSSAELVTMTVGNKTIIGENDGTTMASLSTSVIGSLFNLSGTANLTIYNLNLTSIGATTNGIHLISGTPVVTVDRSRIDKSNAAGVLVETGTVNITRSIITNNAAGGLDLRSASFDIENSFVVQNGSGSSAIGGVSIFQLGSGAHKIDFNTIAQNVTAGADTSGLICQAVNTSITFTDNIITENTNNPQVAGTNCSYTYSNITGATTQPGIGNRNENPMFVDDSSSVGNFHLQAASPLRDKADPGSLVKFDFDGDARPQGLYRDIGADELMP